MAPLGTAPSPTPQFAIISHYHIIWYSWEEFGTITFVAVFFKLSQTVTVPPLTLFTWLHKLNSLNLSSQVMWSETTIIFLSLQLTFPVSKQPSWPGKAPKHKTSPSNTEMRRENTSFFWPHCSCRCWGTFLVPRSLKMLSNAQLCCMCWTPTKSLSDSHIICVCFKVIYSLWSILFLFTIYHFKAYHYSVTFGRHLFYLFSIMSDTSLKLKPKAGA